MKIALDAFIFVVFLGLELGFMIVITEEDPGYCSDNEIGVFTVFIFCIVDMAARIIMKIYRITLGII